MRTMYHPPSSRRQIAKRVLVYSIMTLAVIALVSTLVFYTIGYRFNSNEGTFAQGGLVQMSSRPSGADITINGNSFGSRTSAKTTLAAGSHFIAMQREGYHAWQKTVEVEAGNLLWLNYTRLVPMELNPTSVAELDNVSSTAASQNNQTYAIWQSAEEPVFTLADISSQTVETEEIELPEDVYTVPDEDESQQFAIDSWGPDSRYLLVNHSYGDTQEWLVIDTDNPEQSSNVTRLLAIEADEIKFSYQSSDEVYALIGSDVRRVDLSAATMSRPILTEVAEFSVTESDRLSYVSLLDEETNQKTVGYYEPGLEAAQSLRTIQDEADTETHVALGEYYGDQYQAISHGSQLTITSGEPASEELETVADLEMSEEIHHLSIKTGGRYVVAQTNQAYSVYDIELEKHSITPIKGEADIDKELKWLDNYHLASDRSGHLRMYEFDGANQRNLMEVAPGFAMTYSPDAEYAYAITPAEDDSYSLSRVQLVID